MSGAPIFLQPVSNTRTTVHSVLLALLNKGPSIKDVRKGGGGCQKGRGVSGNADVCKILGIFHKNRY